MESISELWDDEAFRLIHEAVPVHPFGQAPVDCF